MRRPLSGANTRTLPSFHAGRKGHLFLAVSYPQKDDNAAAASLPSGSCPPLILTTDDAVAISHEVQGIARHVGDRDAEQLFGFVYVPQPDILLRAGRK